MKVWGSLAASAAIVLALASPALADPISENVDNRLVERVQCLFIATFEEGHTWEDCLQ